ncbi:hypothetical protein CDAR_442461 [Caerostris darwini]|uniref:Uncharacterized protein n=1 Tax=Caerostris darwini TaxID=1538125 RepID=A0AAV4V0U5_9ARAC|nr:hypothetical protein CDAR_442461 [Caerostris darwini]
MRSEISEDRQERDRTLLEKEDPKKPSIRFNLAWDATIHAELDDTGTYTAEASQRDRNTRTKEGQTRKIDAQKKHGKKNIEDATPAEPAFVIKEEPIEFEVLATEFDPDPSTSADIAIQNAKKYNGDSIGVYPAFVVKEEPIEFDPEPSADTVFMDEFVVSSEDYTGSCAHVPPSSKHNSHVTLSVACLGSSKNRDGGQYVQKHIQ